MRFCSFASGSSGNCIYAGSDTAHLLIDAGISGKRIEQGLNEIGCTGRDISAVLITHEHADHIQGLGVICRRFGLPVYATKATIQAILKSSYIGKIPEGLFREIEPDRETLIGDITVKPFSVSHDAADPVAYRLESGGKKAAVATDMGTYSDYTIRALQELDVLILEANHDVRMLETGRYPYTLKRRILGEKGHLSNEASGTLLCELLHDNIRHILLGHLSKENNYPALAYETVCAEVTMGDNPYKAKDFPISIARRDEAGQLIEF